MGGAGNTVTTLAPPHDSTPKFAKDSSTNTTEATTTALETTTTTTALETTTTVSAATTTTTTTALEITTTTTVLETTITTTPTTGLRTHLVALALQQLLMRVPVAAVTRTVTSSPLAAAPAHQQTTLTMALSSLNKQLY